MDPAPPQPQPSSEPPPTAAALPSPQPSPPSPQPPPSSTSETPPPPTSSTATSTPSNPPQPSPQSQPPPPPQPQLHQLQQQQRPQFPRPRPQSSYPPFQTAVSASTSASSSMPPPTPSSPAMPRAGVAMGLPALHHPRPPQPPVSLSPFGPSSAFGFGSMPRNPGGPPEQSPASSSQVRQPVPGVHSIGMFASLSSGSQIRPSGITAQHQQRPSYPTLRAASPSVNQSSSSQRPQMKSQAFQQRPLHLQQHHQSPMATSNQQRTPSSQQQPQLPPKLQPQQLQQQVSQSQEHHSQQYLQLRNHQSMSQQQLSARALGSASQKSNVPSLAQSGVPGTISPIGFADAGESSNQILGKRSIRELVSQIDPFEKLDPEVEDVLVEIADDFIESITTFACSLAKHRKSTTLEAKDILLHVEKNWNMTLPGFGGDEIKCYKKQSINDIHKERLAAVKKSMIGTSDTGNTKNLPSGQAPTNAKPHAGKVPMITNQSERAS